MPPSNRQALTAIAVLFDSKGAALQATKQSVSGLALRKILTQTEADLTLRWDFDVKPGTYVIRLVIASSDGHTISALSRTVKVV